MAFSAKDAAAMIARLEAAGVRQSHDSHAAVAEAAERPGEGEAKRSKFGNVRCTVDGIPFDSQAEARRYGELCLLQQAGEISELRPSPAQPKKERFTLAGGITYTPDFTYVERGHRVAEDVKGGRATATAHFRDKAKLFRERYPAIELRIIER
jgi:hypothetical protein